MTTDPPPVPNVPWATTPELQDRTREYLLQNKTWGRWGDDDQLGASNLITPERRLAALAAVRSGRTVSLSRPMQPPEEGAIGFFHNEVYFSPQFGDAHMRTAEDKLELRHHGNGITHLDALCHVWLDGVGMWNGRQATEEIQPAAARWADVSQWKEGLIGRAVLLDVPRHRGERFVEVGRPVTSAELRAVLEAQGTEIHPGDILLVYCGREQWEATSPSRSYHWTDEGRAGLGPDCVEFIHEKDVSLLMWDMLESEVLTVHGVLWAFGVGLVDNTDMSRLIPLCREADQYEFCVMIAPLYFPGATGCAVNPIALL